MVLCIKNLFCISQNSSLFQKQNSMTMKFIFSLIIFFLLSFSVSAQVPESTGAFPDFTGGKRQTTQKDTVKILDLVVTQKSHACIEKLFQLVPKLKALEDKSRMMSVLIGKDTTIPIFYFRNQTNIQGLSFTYFKTLGGLVTVETITTPEKEYSRTKKLLSDEWDVWTWKLPSKDKAETKPVPSTKVPSSDSLNMFLSLIKNCKCSEKSMRVNKIAYIVSDFTTSTDDDSTHLSIQTKVNKKTGYLHQLILDGSMNDLVKFSGSLTKKQGNTSNDLDHFNLIYETAPDIKIVIPEDAEEEKPMPNKPSPNPSKEENLEQKEPDPKEEGNNEEEVKSIELTPILKNDKYGYQDNDGNIIIDYQFEQAGEFDRELERAIVQQNSEWFLINDKGEKLEDGYNAYGLTVGKLNDKWGCIDSKGNLIVHFLYDSIIPRFVDKNLIAVRKEDKWGYININGEIVIDIIYDKLNYFNNELVHVILNGKHGIIDYKGNTLIKPLYEGLLNNSKNADIIPAKLNNQWGFIDKKGNILIDFKYDKVTMIGGDKANPKPAFAIVEKNEKKGIINEKGEIVVSMKYDVLQNFYEGLAKVGLNNRYGMMDKTGTIVIPIKYNELSYWYNDDVSDLYTFTDRTAKHLIPVKINGKWGWIDKKGFTIINIKYDTISKFNMHLHKNETFDIRARTVLKGKVIYIDVKGKCIENCDSIEKEAYNEEDAFPDFTGGRVNQPDTTTILDTILDLSDKVLTSIPSSVYRYRRLKTLHLAYNQFSWLPAKIGQLRTLQVLNLSQNQLTSLPTEIGQLFNLTELNLSQNQLTSLPSEIGQLTNLRELNLSENQLTSLPVEIEQLKNLRELYLSGNPILEAEQEKIKKLLPNCAIEF